MRTVNMESLTDMITQWTVSVLNLFFTLLDCFHQPWYYLPVMEIVRTVLPYVQIILSILLTAAILLQQRGSSMGGAFGGDNFSAAYHTRRGAELFLYRLSVVVSILFVASAFLSIML